MKVVKEQTGTIHHKGRVSLKMTDELWSHGMMEKNTKNNATCVKYGEDCSFASLW
jgi:hypothetical protein